MINCALIGYGYWGPNIARSIARMSNVNLTVICDKDKNQLKEVVKIYPTTQIENDIEKVLNKKSVDAVIIATPAITHFSLASMVLKKHKHVLIEKPLATSVLEVNKLRQLNKKIKKIIMVGHTYEYNPSVLKIKDIINNKSFGKIFYAYSSRVNLGQIRGDVNVLWNLAPHDISILNFLLDQYPSEVMAVGTSFLQKGIEDVVFATVKYPNYNLAQLHLSWIDPTKERKMTIVGSKKMLVFDDMDNEMPLKVYDKRVDTAEIARGLFSEYSIKLHSGDIYVPQIEHKEPLYEELKHFFMCIENNKRPITDLENGARVIKILEACQKSLERNSKWVKV